MFGATAFSLVAVKSREDTGKDTPSKGLTLPSYHVASRMFYLLDRGQEKFAGDYV